MHRVVVIGCAGSGKTTFSKRLCEQVGLPFIERDSLPPLGGSEYLGAIDAMTQADDWLLDGAPYFADALVYARADTVVALDYRRSVVMWRVARRTIRIEFLRRPQGAHRPAGIGPLLRNPEHPLRWAWTSYAERSREAKNVGDRPELAGALVLRFAKPKAAHAWLATLG